MRSEGLGLMQFNAYFNPPGLSGAGVVNTRAWRAAEMPSTNTHASAAAWPGSIAPWPPGARSTTRRWWTGQPWPRPRPSRSSGPDVILGRDSRFGLGFQLTQPDRPLGPNPGAFGHFGAGGAVGFCDPASGVAFGYVMNQLGARWQNPRNRALIDAVFTSLA